MDLTHFGHSCLLAEFGATTLLFDPGNFARLRGHHRPVGDPDHPPTPTTPTGSLPALVEANPDAALYADPATAAELAGRGVPHVGDELTIDGLTVAGGRALCRHPPGDPGDRQHLHLVGDDEHPARLMHPGDALFVPGEPVEVLAAPAARRG